MHAARKVIHHAQIYKARERNFEKDCEVDLNGDLDIAVISFYLERMYQMQNSERLRMEGPFIPEDELTN